MAIYELDGKRPQLAAGAWVAESAEVIGTVLLGENASVWCGAIVRGDCDTIRIGRNSNVQDLSMLHGCTVGDGSLIGIQAVVLNNAKIGRNCIVGAGSVVTEGKEFPDNSLIIGSPAKVVRTIDEAARENLAHVAEHYVENARAFAGKLKRID